MALEDKGAFLDTRGEGVPCHILRRLSSNMCVISLLSTGSVVEIELVESLDITRACLITAIHPVPARVVLGDWKEGAFRGCCLTRIDWPKPIGFPPPARYERVRRLDGGKHRLSRTTREEEGAFTGKKRGCFLAEHPESQDARD